MDSAETSMPETTMDVGCGVYNSLITYDDDDETEKPTSITNAQNLRMGTVLNPANI